jgi:lysophospholipase L1-like esterase
VLLIYEGDNDLADGVPVDEVVANAELLFGAIQERLPDTEVVVVAPKASLARANLRDTYLELNARLQHVVEARGMHWVDFWAVQHTPEGTLREELFEADRLHLNDNGYAVWVAELRRQLPWLDPKNHVATGPARHAP